MTYILQLGRTIELCVYEVKQLFSGYTISELDSHHVIIDAISQEEFERKIVLTGGVTKALVIEETFPELKVEEVQEKIIEYFFRHSTKDFTVFSKKEIREHWSEIDIKKGLKAKGLSSRFLEKTAPLGASAAVLLHQNVTEIGLFEHDNSILLAKTIWSQNIDHWTVKDREKPYADRKKGMLPPKLARMMINFISQDIEQQETKQLYDPFCGTGTVLMEALEAGWHVIGSDISQLTITNAAKNMLWFTKQFNLEENYSLFVADAAQVKDIHIKNNVDAIVTEPFLGKQTPNPKELGNIFKGLEKMYLGALKRWTGILRKGGEVVIIFPYVKTAHSTYTMSKIIDKLPEFGYTILSGPLLYSREETTVQRAIYHLKYKAT